MAFIKDYEQQFKISLVSLSKALRKVGYSSKVLMLLGGARPSFLKYLKKFEVENSKWINLKIHVVKKKEKRFQNLKIYPPLLRWELLSHYSKFIGQDDIFLLEQDTFFLPSKFSHLLSFSKTTTCKSILSIVNTKKLVSPGILFLKKKDIKKLVGNRNFHSLIKTYHHHLTHGTSTKKLYHELKKLKLSDFADFLSHIKRKFNWVAEEVVFSYWINKSKIPHSIFSSKAVNNVVATVEIKKNMLPALTHYGTLNFEHFKSNVDRF